MEILLTFENTTSAIGAEKELLDKGLNIKIMNIPSSIKAGCGIALRVPPTEFKNCITILRKINILPEDCYIRKTENGKATYAPYMEEKNER